MVLLPGLALALMALFSAACGAAGYDVHAPVSPVTYTDVQRAAQRTAYLSVQRDMAAKVKAGAAGYTVPPGVYRIAANAPGLPLNAKGTALRVAGCEFILENHGTFLGWSRAWGELASLSILGPVKFDDDPHRSTQGVIRAYDPETGIAQVEIMPGYRTDLGEKAGMMVYSPSGKATAAVFYEGYDGGKALGGRLFQMNLGKARDLAASHVDPARNRVGNYVSVGLAGDWFLSLDGVNNLTLRDVDVYVGGVGLAWGGGRNWSFLNVRGIPRPGTNRLGGISGTQVTVSGRVLFDGCELSGGGDDLIDVSGGGMAEVLRQDSPTRITVYQARAWAGDTLQFYDGKPYLPIGTAVAASADEVPKSDPEYAALIKKAQEVAAATPSNFDRNWIGAVTRITLRTPLALPVGSFMMDRAGREAFLQMTVRRCYFHDCGGHVLSQGFNQGLFEDNRFENVHGGLHCAPDTWNWRSPGQHLIVRRNVFRSVTNSTGWPHNEAALVAGAGAGAAGPAQSAAAQEISISDNLFLGSVTGGVYLSDAGRVTVTGNRFDGIQGWAGYGDSGGNPPIALNAVLDGVVSGNRIARSAGPAISIANSSRVRVVHNSLGGAAVQVSASRGVTQAGNVP